MSGEHEVNAPINENVWAEEEKNYFEHVRDLAAARKKQIIIQGPPLGDFAVVDVLPPLEHPAG